MGIRAALGECAAMPRRGVMSASSDTSVAQRQGPGDGTPAERLVNGRLLAANEGVRRRFA